MIPTFIYKILRADQWDAFQATRVFRGSPIDRKDGFIHFSTAEQLDETIAKHFAGIEDLIVLKVPTAPLGDALKMEPSRGGDLFPHLYRDLNITEFDSFHSPT